MNYEELKAEAPKRGIVEGAKMASMSTAAIFTVPHADLWYFNSGDLCSGMTAEGDLFGMYSKASGKWATVIAAPPAPTIDTLQPNDACECGPQMREAIRAMAVQRGFQTTIPPNTESHQNAGVGFRTIEENVIHTTAFGLDHKWIRLPASEFIRRLENSKPQTKEPNLERALGLLKYAATVIGNDKTRLNELGKQTASANDILAMLAAHGIKP